jgi:hypothetical protein
LIEQYDHIKLIDHGNTEEIYNLIQNAQINILYTLQDTGIKLKLLNALYKGRHCIVNHKMVDNTGLETLCLIADNPDGFIRLVKEYWERPFSKENIEIRSDFFNNNFNTVLAANKLIDAISFSQNQTENPKAGKQMNPTLLKPKKTSVSLSSLLGLLPF